jgi:hypothetical protein
MFLARYDAEIEVVRQIRCFWSTGGLQTPKTSDINGVTLPKFGRRLKFRSSSQAIID